MARLLALAVMMSMGANSAIAQSLTTEATFGAVSNDSMNAATLEAVARKTTPDTMRRGRHDLALSAFLKKQGGLRAKWLNLGLIGGADTLKGFQLNAMTSFVPGEMRGLQISGISNVASGMRGVQLSAFGNVSLSPFRGVQVAGVTNISRGVQLGVQLSPLSNISSSYMRGLQIGSYNYADTLNGSQIGLVNVCIRHPRGVQIGIVNYSRDTMARKIGLVNVNPKTRIDFMAFGGNNSKINFGVRFRNRSTYNVVGVGTHYMGLDKKFSGALFYRVGQYFALSPRWSVSGDVGFFHIETFRRNSAIQPERLYSLQARANVDYRITRRLSAFASVGYGDTRRYAHNRDYRHGMIFEAGLALSYDRNLPKSPFGGVLMDNDVADSTDLFAWDRPSFLRKRPWKAALEVVGINVLVNSFDRFAMGEEWAKVNLHTVKQNFKTGFVWDNDQFSTNLFAHPYHGGLYFNAARSNGMGFWESAPYALGGSLMWELTCETEPPAINDLMATTMGGICIGEITHRLSSLAYDDSKRGFGRFLRELLGAAVCPIRGLNRLMSGDAWRIRREGGRYHDYKAIPVAFSVTAGDRYLADEGGLFRGEHNPYIDLLLIYGDPFSTVARKPYDYFTANITFGMSSNQPLISSVHLLGKIWGTTFYEGKEMSALFGLFQHFNYYDSEAVKDGTSKVPYRISEAASFGPGLIYRFPKVGNLGSMEQRVFLDAILLGGSLSDYYDVKLRDYNMGSGMSAKAQTVMEFPKFGHFSLSADYYLIYTWKGYKGTDLSGADPIHLNVQGDKSYASLLVVSPKLKIYLKGSWSLDVAASYYMRDTRYKYRPDVHSETFEVRAGLSYGI